MNPLMLEDMFALIEACPDAPLMARADVGPAISWRTLDEVHPCARCGSRARVTYYHPGGPLTEWRPCWLDLCRPCSADVTRLVNGDWDEADARERWRAWKTRRVTP